MSAAFQKEVLRQLRRNGSDLSMPHDFEFFIYLPTKAIANAVASQIRRTGFAAAEVSRAGSGNGWLCIASKSLVPSAADLSKHARFFERLAAAGGGEFDGWEAKIV